LQIHILYIRIYAARSRSWNSVNSSLAKVHERVTRATGVSDRTITRIAKEQRMISSEETCSFLTPNKKRKKQNSKITLDDFDLGVLRRMIVNLHVTEQKTPRLKEIYNKFCEDIRYTGSGESLRGEIHKLGFRWRKFKNNRKITILTNSSLSGGL
jgi:hypothetical protein